MKRWLSAITLALSLATAVPCPAASNAPLSAREIQESLDGFVAKAPGVVVIVGLVDHGVTRIFTSGKPPSGAPKLDASTEFQIGAVTNTFTATLLADMARHGALRLDDPISKYLPADVHAPSFGGQQITLLSLAEQNSGLPVLPTNLIPRNFNDPAADYGTKQLYEFLNGYTLTRAPGSQYEYSSVGPGLLGTLLANAAHTTYGALLKSRILVPLGMRDTSVDESAIRARLMPGFDASFKPAAAWTFDALAGAGAINSDMKDMLVYLKANIAAPAGPLGPAMLLAQRARVAANSTSRIGLLWTTGRTGLVWHNGETGGYHSVIVINREGGVGVVLLTNIASDSLDKLAAHLIVPALVPTAPVLAH